MATQQIRDWNKQYLNANKQISTDEKMRKQFKKNDTKIGVVIVRIRRGEGSERRTRTIADEMAAQ